MIRKMVASAVFAGFAAGVVIALLQLAFVQPVLLHAELYEGGTLTHFGATSGGHGDVDTGGFDFARDGLSVLFTALIYTGYALLMVAGFALASERGVTIDARSGLLWGLAGYAAFHLAPAAGLPPELPGSAAGEVGSRQVWWFACAALTAAGLAVIAFGGRAVTFGAGVVLILAPHVIGAPEPVAFEGVAPPELAAHFAARALAVGMAGWAILGALAGHFWARAD